MADGDSSGSDGDDTAPRMEESDLRSLFSAEEWEIGTKFPEPDTVPTKHFELLVSLGSLNFPGVLRSMVDERRWLDIGRYLRRALRFHAKDAAEAVAYPPARPDHIRRAHPELYVLPRRQHALELLGQGKRQEALRYYHDAILARIHPVRRNAHVDELLSSLAEIINQDKPLDLGREALETHKAIEEYIELYFPRLRRGVKLRGLPGDGDKLGGSCRFGWLVLPLQQEPCEEHHELVRCLVCHSRLHLRSPQHWTFTEHLYTECPAMTPYLRKQLPRPHLQRLGTRRDQDLAQDEADAAAEAAAAAGGGGGGAGGAGIHGDDDDAAGAAAPPAT
ncbi:hypothetical protein ACP70R_020225 [Stipagrostis hirtigluma subsp. patula]